MSEADEIRLVLDSMLAKGAIDVHEGGELLAELINLQFEVRQEGKHALIHLWSDERNLVRRVVRVAERAENRLVLEVQRFGRRQPGRLELVCSRGPDAPAKLSRGAFRNRFRRFLAEQFPDEQLLSLTSAADLEHTFSGNYCRGVVARGHQAWAVMGVSVSESAAVVDAILSFGLLWLDWTKFHSGRRTVAGLRVFLPTGRGAGTAHRVRLLCPQARVELCELDEKTWRARPVDLLDTGNVATWLTPRREIERTLEAAREAIHQICDLAPEAIDAVVPAGTREVAFRFRGLEFARWQEGGVHGPWQEGGLSGRFNDMDAIREAVRELDVCRDPHAADRTHPLYRSQAERWLETMILADPSCIDAQLHPQFLYSQVPAFSGGDRGVLDLLGVRRDGRLVVIELKASEDVHLVLQGADYWQRVWHHQQNGELQKYGYFPGIELQARPPLLYLVAPGFQFHPATDTILKYLTPQIEVHRIGLNEGWRAGPKVVFRM